MSECECNEAKYAVIVLNKMQMMKNIKILCDKCDTIWGYKEEEAGRNGNKEKEAGGK
jgi:hypothetical protein